MSIQTIGLVGSGAMGRGIAQLLAQAGSKVYVYDVQASAISKAIETIATTWQSLVAKGRMTEQARTEAMSRLVAADALSGLKDCDMVVEAIVERLDIKQSLFKDLEAIVRPDCILASNTSSLSIAALAKGCAQPQRVAGYHFFNPVPLMKVVEVIKGPRTEQRVVDQLCELSKKAGHLPVVAADMPGFIVNHAGRGFGTESLKALGEGVADIPTIDAIMKEQVVLGTQGGFKLGPFELMDLTGLDVSHPVMESIYEQFYQEPRYRPSALAAQRCAAGLIGRKAGEGFYRYQDGKGTFVGDSITWPAPANSSALSGIKVALSPRAARDHAAALQALIEGAGAQVIAQREQADILLDTPLGLDLTSSLVEQNLGAYASKALALDTFFPFAWKACKRRVLMACPASSDSTLALGQALAGADGAAVSLLRDSPGFIAPRVIAMIVCIAAEIAQQRIATPLDINQAVKIGLGYPLGPLDMGDALGNAKVLQLLQELERCTGDPRYRASAWLHRRAHLGLSLSHPG